MGRDQTDGGYDKTQSPAANATADIQRVTDDKDYKSAVDAQNRLSLEASAQPAKDGVPAGGLVGVDNATQEAYRAELAKQLQASKILPELSIAAVKQMGAEVKDGDVYSPQKLIERMSAEKDPVRRTQLEAFIKQYDSLKRESPDGKVTDATLQARLEKTAGTARENATLRDKRDNDRRDLGSLAANPELFKEISGTDGQITKADAENFRKRLTEGTSQADIDMRAKFAKTPEEFAALKKTTDNLIASFSKPENEPGKKGSPMKDGSTFYRGNGSKDYMTNDTLAQSMGFNDAADAKAKYRPEAAVAAAVKPNPDVTSVTDYRNTAQGKNEGPYQVTAKMLQGQEKFFTNPAEAQRMLQGVVAQEKFWGQDKQGVPKVTAANRDEMLKSIKEAEAKKAADSKQPENNDLSRWFESRYPKDLPAAAPAVATPAREVKPDTGYASTKIGGDGSWGVSSRMLKDSGLDEGARQVLQNALRNKAVSGIDFMSANGPVINDGNVEKIRDAIKANEQLLAWYNKRYPKKA